MSSLKQKLTDGWVQPGSAIPDRPQPCRNRLGKGVLGVKASLESGAVTVELGWHVSCGPRQGASGHGAPEAAGGRWERQGDGGRALDETVEQATASGGKRL